MLNVAALAATRWCLICWILLGAGSLLAQWQLPALAGMGKKGDAVRGRPHERSPNKRAAMSEIIEFLEKLPSTGQGREAEVWGLPVE